MLENSEVSSDSGCETNSSQLHPLPDSKSETAEEESDLDNTFGYVDLAPDAFGEVKHPLFILRLVWLDAKQLEPVVLWALAC